MGHSCRLFMVRSISTFSEAGLHFTSTNMNVVTLHCKDRPSMSLLFARHHDDFPDQPAGALICGSAHEGVWIADFLPRSLCFLNLISMRYLPVANSSKALSNKLVGK